MPFFQEFKQSIGLAKSKPSPVRGASYELLDSLSYSSWAEKDIASKSAAAAYLVRIEAVQVRASASTTKHTELKVLDSNNTSIIECRVLRVVQVLLRVYSINRAFRSFEDSSWKIFTCSTFRKSSLRLRFFDLSLSFQLGCIYLISVSMPSFEELTLGTLIRARESNDYKENDGPPSGERETRPLAGVIYN